MFTTSDRVPPMNRRPAGRNYGQRSPATISFTMSVWPAMPTSQRRPRGRARGAALLHESPHVTHDIGATISRARSTAFGKASTC
jgi:hypothetical protein